MATISVHRHPVPCGDPGQGITRRHGVTQVIQRGHGDRLTGLQRLRIGAGGRGGTRHRLQIAAKIQRQRPEGVVRLHDVGEAARDRMCRTFSSTSALASRQQRQEDKTALTISFRGEQPGPPQLRRAQSGRRHRRRRGDDRRGRRGRDLLPRGQGQAQGRSQDSKKQQPTQKSGRCAFPAVTLHTAAIIHTNAARGNNAVGLLAEKTLAAGLYPTRTSTKRVM